MTIAPELQELAIPVEPYVEVTKIATEADPQIQHDENVVAVNGITAELKNNVKPDARFGSLSALIIKSQCGDIKFTDARQMPAFRDGAYYPHRSRWTRVNRADNGELVCSDLVLSSDLPDGAEIVRNI